MKVESKTAAIRNEFSMKADGYRVQKRTTGAELAQEMDVCFQKLKELVPTIPSKGKLSQVALLQHVIDYILDLELTLECNADGAVELPLDLMAMSQTAPKRTPLAESTQFNTLLNQVRPRLINYFFRVRKVSILFRDSFYN